MKKFIAVLIAVLMLASVMCVGASAANYEPIADELCSIGMLRGTGEGFDLDRAPNRAEVATMLVRLYGAEEEALADFAAGKIEAPFTDTSWDAPYVAWLYSKGMTKGISETEFGSRNLCSAHDYAVFMLRALGYKDNVDFTYMEAAKFAEEKGFFSPMLIGDTFLRDDLAAVTYQTLAAATKDGKGTLLDSLVASGAVSKEAAAPIIEKFNDYSEINKAAAFDYTALDADLFFGMDIIMDLDGAELDVPISLSGNIKVIENETSPLLSQIAVMACAFVMDETVAESEVYFKDGTIYVIAYNGTETPEKYKMDLSFAEELMSAFPQENAADISTLAFVLDTDISEIDGETHYSCLLNGKAVMALVGDILSALGMDEGISIDVGDIVVDYVVKDGVLASVYEEFDMAMTIDAGEAGTVDASSSIFAVVEVNAVGDAVKIDYPDFSDFAELDMNELIAEAGI